MTSNFISKTRKTEDLASRNEKWNDVWCLRCRVKTKVISSFHFLFNFLPSKGIIFFCYTSIWMDDIFVISLSIIICQMQKISGDKNLKLKKWLCSLFVVVMLWQEIKFRETKAKFISRRIKRGVKNFENFHYVSII